MGAVRRLETGLEGLVLLEPEVHGDQRGFLVETWRHEDWRAAGIEVEFVQHNHSRSSRDTLRGIHFQVSPGQAKLVRCVRGEIFDVAVDLRSGSPTFGKWEGHLLDDVRHRQLYLPVGFGHGFCVVSPEADVSYQLSTPYDPGQEGGIRWDDPDVGIDWPVSTPILSERDRSAPSLGSISESLPW